MTHIMKMRWGMYKDELRKILSERTGLNDCNYEDLVCNAIKPYNYGWREDEGWLPAKDGE